MPTAEGGGAGREGPGRSDRTRDLIPAVVLLVVGVTTVRLAAGGPAESPGARPAAPVTGATLKAMREVEQSGKVRRMLTELRRQIEDNFDNVGPRFAQEARKIHYGEGEERAIYGETTDEEARELHEEGVQVRRIPWLPREDA